MKKYILFALSLAFLATGCSSTEEKKKDAPAEKKNLSLQLYSLRDSIKSQGNYDWALAETAKIGFTSIEAAGYGDGKFYGKTPEEFKADLEKNGLTLLSSHTTRQLDEKELASKDFTEAMKWWDQCIDAHAAAGAKFIVAPWQDVPKTVKDLQTYCEYYNEIGKKCKEKGLSFGYHNHAHEFKKVEDKVVMLDYMLENTNPENVFFQMDVYWVVRGAQSPVEYFNKYPKRFRILHLKDHKELGQSGMVGFDAIFKNTDVAGVEYMIVEVEKYNHEPAVSIKESYDYLQSCPILKTSYVN